MISSEAISSFSQYNEDLILASLLPDVKNGFYIDAGANFPVTDSVTQYFYARGWRGINIEPILKLHKQLVKNRPDDINLACGLADKEGVAKFTEFTKVHGHSTFIKQNLPESSGDIKEYEVPITTIKSIYLKYSPPKVNFMKIDVEGYEYEVINGNDWNKYRPEIICIEANHVVKDWRKILENNKYGLFIHDGLNEYYVAEESWGRTVGFEERVIKLSYNALKQHQYEAWTEDSKQIKILTIANRQLNNTLEQKQAEINQLSIISSLSLKDQTLHKRLRRTAYGLTVDWFRFHKKNK
jgi:FkbM family methyltransferase